MFCDEAFNVNIDRVAELCRLMIKRGLDTKWGVETRVYLPFRGLDMLDLMVKAGLLRVLVGMESRSEGNLALVREGITREQAERVVKALRDRAVLAEKYE